MSRVLVVEDDESIREAMALGLGMGEIAVVSARGGAEALALLESDRPDLILLDLRMPIMDGFEFARRYEAMGGRAPLVVMTAAGDATRAAEGLAAAAVLQKPFDLEELLSVVRATLRAEAPA